MIKKQYTIIKNSEDLIDLHCHIKEYDYFGFDTETTGLNVRKDRVIGFSLCGKEGESYYMPRLSWDKEKQELVQMWEDEVFLDTLRMLKDKGLIMWNASYDVQIVKKDLGLDFIKNLEADAMLLKHTTDEEGRFGLKTCAIEEQENIQVDAENMANQEQIELKENVKANGGRWTKDNKDMFMADLEVMGKYACADADYTLRLAHLYGDRMEEQGLDSFFYDEEVMPLYKEVTIPMEENGILLDIPYIEQTDKEITEDMSKLESKVIAELLEEPLFDKWFKDKLNKDFPIKKGGAFGQAVAEYFELDLPKTKSGKYSLSAKNIEKLSDSPAKIFFTSENGLLSTEICEKIQEKLFWKVNDKVINISSKQQMGELVCEYMKIKPLSTTPTDKPQFDDDFVTHLADKFEWAKTLQEYNRLVKIKGTYIDPYLANHEEGRFYPYFKQHGTISGRYSSNIQQLPRPFEEGQGTELERKYRNRIRAFFIAEEGRCFIDADYESLEPHVFSHVSGDEKLRDIFRKGHDFYSTIAIATEKLEGVSADKKAKNYLGIIDKVKRQTAKAYSLGIPYGMQAFLLGISIGVSTEEAQRLIDGYLGGFPDLAQWMESSEEFVKHHGWIATEAGRIRHLPRVKELYKKHKDKLLDWKYRNSLVTKLVKKGIPKKEAKAKVKSTYRDYKNGLDNAKNVQIQGLSASIVNRAMIAINREFKKRNIDAWVCATIHDQIICNVPENKKEECAELVEYIMCNNVKLSVTLKAPAEISQNFKDGH